MMKKRMTAIVLMICILLCAGCAKKEAAESQAPETKPAESTSAETESGTAETEEKLPSFPVTLIDQAGRSVTIEKKPEKFVSGYYISTSAFIALGVQDKLVGIEAKADKRAIYRLSAPELMVLPNVGSAKEFDLEGCAALKPDVAILPLKLKEAAETLESLGIKVVLVNPESRTGVREMVAIIAALTETQDRAAELTAFDFAQEKVLTDLPKEKKPLVYIASNSDFLSTAGPKMYQSDLVTLAGGVNAASGIEDTYWAQISYEQLLKWNPDVILIASEASYTVDDVLKDPALTDVTAVKNRAVYMMPNEPEPLDSPVPGAILGSVYAASLFHDDFTEEQAYGIIKDYYQRYYGFEFSENN